MVSVDACHKMKLGSNPSRSKEISSKMSHRQNGWEMEKVRKQEFGGENSGGKRIAQNERTRVKKSRSQKIRKSENQKIRKPESQKVKINENQSDESKEKEEKWKKKREESKNRRMRRK